MKWYVGIGCSVLVILLLIALNSARTPKTQKTSREHLSVVQPALQKEVQERAWKRVEARLEQADDETRTLTSKLVSRIEEFFEERKTRVEAFAQAALSWRSKWELIKSREGHRAFIEDRFTEYLFSPQELESFLQEANDEYERAIHGIDNSLLVAVRADLSDLPAELIPQFASDELLRQRYSAIVTEVMDEAIRDAGIDLGQAVGSFVIGEVIAVVVKKTLVAAASRLGVSSAILASGAAASWATFGAGIVVAFAVDLLLDWLIGWYHDPVGSITEKVTSTLDIMKSSITAGDRDAWDVYNKLLVMGESDPEKQNRDKARAVAKQIENGGILGLKYTLGRVANVRQMIRTRSLQQLVLGEMK